MLFRLAALLVSSSDASTDLRTCAASVRAWLGSILSAIYLGLAGIISDATAALATDKLPQSNITVRKPNTNAREIDMRINAAVSASSPEGSSRPASLISFDRTYWRRSGGSGAPVRLRFKLQLNNLTITIPMIA